MNTFQYRSARNQCALIILFTLRLLGFSDANAVTTGQVILDHTTGEQDKWFIELEKNEPIVFTVRNTNRTCYTFNFTAVQPAKNSDGSNRAPAIGQAADHSEIVEIPTVHDGTATEYKIVVAKIQGKDSTTCYLPDITWHVAVKTTGWSILFSGAATISRLTDPVFVLRPMKGATAGPVNYVVTSDDRARDGSSYGAAIMAHLYHSACIPLWKNCILEWAPLSFGVGISDKTNGSYFVGTSIKFSDSWLITLGEQFGKTARLPNGVSVGDLTTNANLISTLGSRMTNAAFLAISFKVGELDTSPLSGLFKKATSPATPTPKAAPPAP